MSDKILTKTYDHCESKTPKLTVVMIHGIASNSKTYKNALEHLIANPKLKDVRFVTFDLLGMGESPKNDDFRYDYNDQLTALDESINELGANTPLVLVGHSLGSFIATRYVSLNGDKIHKLILISTPVYTKRDLNNPDFDKALQSFKDSVSAKMPGILDDAAFNNSMEYIVKNEENYDTLANLKTPVVMIYGSNDQIIASYNYPFVLKDNPDHITAIETNGGHGVTGDKYTVLSDVLEGTVNA